MAISRRNLVLLGAFTLAARASQAQPGPLDAVPVYLVPLDDFPEDLAGSLARILQEDLGFRVKASVRLPPLRVPVLPGTNQYVSDDVLILGAVASRSLPEMAPTTYRLFLTTRDINARSANLRFLFSSHNPELNCSVVSMARLMEYANDQPVYTELVGIRLLKMIKRAIGEIHMGWSRSPDPADLMYAPLMSLDDLDRLGLEHEPEVPEVPAPAPPPAPPPRERI